MLQINMHMSLATVSYVHTLGIIPRLFVQTAARTCRHLLLKEGKRVMERQRDSKTFQKIMRRGKNFCDVWIWISSVNSPCIWEGQANCGSQTDLTVAKSVRRWPVTLFESCVCTRIAILQFCKNFAIPSKIYFEKIGYITQIHATLGKMTNVLLVIHFKLHLSAIAWYHRQAMTLANTIYTLCLPEAQYT